MVLASIPVLGALRFGVNRIATSAPVFSVANLLRRMLFAGLAAAVFWISTDATLSDALSVFSTCLVITAAILTADFITKMTQKVTTPKRVDWIAVTAPASGGATARLVQFLMASEAWWNPWLFPAY